MRKIHSTDRRHILGTSQQHLQVPYSSDGKTALPPYPHLCRVTRHKPIVTPRNWSAPIFPATSRMKVIYLKATLEHKHFDLRSLEPSPGNLLVGSGEHSPTSTMTRGIMLFDLGLFIFSNAFVSFAYSSCYLVSNMLLKRSRVHCLGEIAINY